MNSINFYQILGLQRHATADEIKKQYYKLAKEFHPDRHSGDKVAEEKFKQIGEAYECLSDPNKRAQYNYSLDALQIRIFQIQQARNAYLQRQRLEIMLGRAALLGIAAHILFPPSPRRKKWTKGRRRRRF